MRIDLGTDNKTINLFFDEWNIMRDKKQKMIINYEEYFEWKINYKVEEDSENEIIKIKISEIDDFKNHPYKVELGDELNTLVESIKLNGLLVPIVVRRKDDDRYELLSGHRRKKVYEILCLEEIDAVIKDLNDYDATIYMVDSNMYREKLLPSEKAFSYRMKMEAMKHQGKTSCHNGTKLRSDEKLSEKTNDSARQI